MVNEKTVKAERTAGPGCEIIELDFRGWDYSGSRWAETPPAHRGGCASGSYPFGLIVNGRIFLHNAVVKAAYIGAESGEIRYGAGRNAARYEEVSEETVLNLATREPYARSARELEKEEGIRAAFAALVEVL